MASLCAHRERRPRDFELAIGQHDEEPLLPRRVIDVDPKCAAIEVDHFAVAVSPLGPHRRAVSVDDGAHLHWLRARSHAPENEDAGDEGCDRCRPEQPAPSARAALRGNRTAVERGE
jgi:hypothetical protein